MARSTTSELLSNSLDKPLTTLDLESRSIIQHEINETLNYFNSLLNIPVRDSKRNL